MLKITQRAIQTLHEIANGRIVHLKFCKRNNDSLAESVQDCPFLAMELLDHKSSGYLDYDSAICFLSEDPVFLESYTIDTAYSPYGKVPRIILR